MILKKEILLVLDAKNANGRIYRKADVEKHLDDLNSRTPMLGAILDHITENDGDLPLNKVIFDATDFEITDNKFVADIRMLPAFDILDIDINDYVFRPISIGSPDEDGNIILENIQFVAMLHSDKDSYAGLVEPRQ